MVLKRTVAALSLLAFAVMPLFAQSTPLRVIQFLDRGGMEVSLVNAPNIGGTSGGGGGNGGGQWLKIELHYSVNPAGTVPYVDAVEFKVVVEGRDMYAADAPGKDGVAVGMTGTVTYINLPKGRDAYGVFYVHPSTLARYCTKEGVSDFDRRFNVHVDALVGGTVVDYFDKKKDAAGLDWYKSLRPIAGLVYRMDQSPFALADVDRYPAMKLPTTSQGQ